MRRSLFWITYSWVVFWSLNAWALPESMLGTHLGGVIPKMLEDTKGNIAQVRQTFSKTGVQVLDELWDSRRDVTIGECSKTRNDCRILSVFAGKTSDHPMVLLPGFTGYRKMFLEEAYDLIQAGYGPIYVPDFGGTGDSFKPELNPGEPEPTVGEVAKIYEKAGAAYRAHIADIVGNENVSEIKSVLDQIPLGMGYIRDMNDYDQDIEFVMSTAIADHPDKKIDVATLSMSGMSLLIALDHQDANPTWAGHVGRIVLESPMLRLRQTDKLGGGLVAQLLSPFGELINGGTKYLNPEGGMKSFAEKALGYIDPAGAFTHSPNRVSLGDSIRVWNSHETAGSTYSWGFQVLSHQYALDWLDHFPFVESRMNLKEKSIRDVLSRNGIALTAVTSFDDQIVDPRGTISFFNDLAQGIQTELNLCTMKGSTHQIDEESDRYRDPFMALLYDQKNQLVKPEYGLDPQHEPIHCQKLH